MFITANRDDRDDSKEFMLKKWFDVIQLYKSESRIEELDCLIKETCFHLQNNSTNIQELRKFANHICTLILELQEKKVFVEISQTDCLSKKKEIFARSHQCFQLYLTQRLQNRALISLDRIYNKFCGHLTPQLSRQKSLRTGLQTIDFLNVNTHLKNEKVYVLVEDSKQNGEQYFGIVTSIIKYTLKKAELYLEFSDFITCEQHRFCGKYIATSSLLFEFEKLDFLSLAFFIN